MSQHNKNKNYRSKSAGPVSVIERRGKHAQMMDLMPQEDRLALKFNKFEEAYTLAQLQDKIKRQSDQYKPEFAAHWKIFQKKLADFKENPAKKDQDIIDYFKFMSHISNIYQAQIASFLSNEMLNLLQQYYSILHQEVRHCLVTCLKVMRGKDNVPATAVLPVFLKLFKCKDKALRKYLHSIIIADIKQLNKDSKNHGINKKLQNFILGLMQDPNEDASKRALNVMIELYKRHIWNDEKTVNAIWQGCEHANPKIVAASCKFFLILEYDYKSDSEDDSSSDDDAAALLANHKGGIMTKAKKAKFQRAIKAQKRKEARKNKVHKGTDFLPIDTLYDPQAAAERLFSKLKKSNDKYDVKLLMLRLVSRLIGRHSLLILQFYPFVLRYLNSHDKEKIGEIFAMIIESCHDLVPPEEIKPIIERIIQNYVTDYCQNQDITIGLNAIREILTRMPLALDQAQVEYFVDFRHNKNKSVMAAAKSLINFFRDVCPQMLPKKYVGRFTDTTEKDMPTYGEKKIHKNIEGIEYLKEGEDVITERLLTDKDLKKIRIMKLRAAVRQVDRKGFRSSSEEESDVSMGEEGEEDMSGEEFEDEKSENSDQKDGQQQTQQSKVLALEQYKQMHSSQDEDAENEEMGESAMDEFSFEEDGESYYENADLSQDEDVAPALVPINVEKKQKPDRDYESDTPQPSEESVQQSEISSSEIDSDEAVDQNANAHGFVFSTQLNTYRQNKRERLENTVKDRLDNKDERRALHKKRERKLKGKSSTNVIKTRNKPFSMLLPKRVLEKHWKDSDVRGKLKKRDKNAVGQLGHMHKSTKQRIQAKKQKLQF